MSEPALEVGRLVAGYGKGIVLHGIDFSVGSGEMLAIVGANGAGKTTTLRALAGAIRPAAGTVRLGGTAIQGLPDYKTVRRGLAHVPEGRRLFPSLTTEENLQLGSLPLGARAARRNRETLASVFEVFPSLVRRRKVAARRLSGGEQQMLAIGRALMSRPKVLLLDEPSTGLAPSVVTGVFDAIARLSSSGLAVVLVEQAVEAALSRADVGVVLRGGRVVLSGRSSELLAAPERLTREYFGVEGLSHDPAIWSRNDSVAIGHRSEGELAG